MWSKNYAISLALCIFVLHQINAEHFNNTITWCTVSESEQNKCEAFSRAVEREKSFFDYNYMVIYCKRAFDKDECMTMLDHEVVQITTLDAGEVFTAGRYHSIIPIMQEMYQGGINYQYAVAVIKDNTLLDVQSLHDLRGKKACFAGVGTLAGWVIPVNTLMKHGGLELIDCNNHVQSTIKYFGPSCAVNSLIDRYNPLGDNSDQLCQLCIGEVPSSKCTSQDPYAGYEGALRCLVEAGEIAFLVHTSVEEMTSTTFDFVQKKKDDFKLLCKDGTRRSVDEYRICNWGRMPSRAVVMSSAIKFEIRRLYQKFLEKAVRVLHRNKNETGYPSNDHFDSNQNDYENRSGYKYGDNGFNTVRNGGFDYPYDYSTESPSYNHNREYTSNEPTNVQPIEMFDLFESAPRYGIHHNLIFSDATINFVHLPEKDQKYESYLGRSLDDILGVRRCPVNRMTLCVTSDPEMDKCIKMKIALKAQLLEPELFCYRGFSQINCMQSIHSGIADVAVLDASDVYTAGQRFELIPIISEVYNLGSPDYYVVAVAKEEDDNTDLTYLKNKNTCHTGINTAAGWVYPLAYLISNQWIRGYGCDSVRAAAEYFSKSCVPGALSTEYNIDVPYDNMCDLCHGASYRYCRRDASEDYFGYTGAFRCLVEGGGDVAFVKHTTVMENTDGKRKEFWARNTFTKDFELLCPDGTRRPTTSYAKCNLGKVAANAIVTRGGYYGYNETQINAYINLFIYAQQFYGSKELDEFSFSMYYSVPPYSDLIFQDATQQLVVVPMEKREYSRYLGPDFMRARRIVDCNAGASAISYSLFATVVMIVFTFVYGR
ncbi:PREDICTED: melanotransferrin isoform X1 [Dinoponera quadriceps]|uniref:Melanotransferrin isoform X1 n=1 Tax=Dinoponera quadriceps TaxID=609295 RepID=A0A6P3Y2B1_DINQU|nr:PREDICTED: melanotransferrin isoform X1 [Dinoponera quadriceps]